MAHHRSNFFDTRFAGFLLGAALVLLPGEGVAEASEGVVDDGGIMSVPAEHVYSLRLPGMQDHIRRPSAVFVDHAHGEVFVGDAGLNRVLIFDRGGLYRYEFNFSDQVGSVVDVAVDSKGFVYVLGSSRNGLRVLQYDFDGVFLNDLQLAGLDPRSIEALTIDEDDHLVIIGVDGTCSLYETSGVFVRSFETAVGIDSNAAMKVVRGKPRVNQGRLLLPITSAGTVYVFDLATGQRTSSVGVAGNTPGLLGAPVAVDVMPSGLIVVLDRLRFNVQCYSPSGRFLGEFGGRGYRDGWMYFPSLLSAVRDDEVIVGQLLDHRVQALRIPEFVLERLSRESVTGGEDVLEGEGKTSDGPLDSDPRTP